MDEFTSINRAGEALKALGYPCRIGVHPANEWVPRLTFTVALNAPVPGGEVIGTGNTPDMALAEALVKRDQAFADQDERDAFEAWRARREAA